MIFWFWVIGRSDFASVGGGGASVGYASLRNTTTNGMSPTD
jgi:hypothetical protein